MNRNLKILLAAGGSGGPVSPMLAVAEEIKNQKPQTEFLFVGTSKGPERSMVEPLRIPFETIVAAKWHRFLTVKNFFTPIFLLIGFYQALKIVKKFQPDIVFSTGSFVAVPICYAAKFYKAKIIIHQQDAGVGLANKLVAPLADQITTAFEQTSKEFYSGSGFFGPLKPKAVWVGNPVREDLYQPRADVKKFFHLHDDLPVLLVLGGATGALQINKIIAQIIPSLIKNFQVVHQTGKGKKNIEFSNPNYHPIELIPFPEYASILKLAHIVIARAGLSTIAELSALGKVAIIIPMPGTHQEQNARVLERYRAAIPLFGKDAQALNISGFLNTLKFNPQFSETLSKNMLNLMPKDATQILAKIVLKTL